MAGDTLPALAESVAWGGQILLYGALNSAPTPYPLGTAFARNLTLRTHIIYTYIGNSALGIPRNEGAYERGLRFVCDALAAGRLKPVIAKTFPLEAIVEAHRYMESNEQLGKIVVTNKGEE